MTDSTIVQRLNSPDPAERAAAVAALLEKPDLEGLLVCRRLARLDPAHAVKSAARQALITLRQQAGTMASARLAALASPDPRVRWALVMEIGFGQDPTHGSSLVAHIGHETVPEVRAAAALALAASGHKDATAVLFSLVADQDADVALTALRALVDLDPQEARAAAVTVVERPSDPELSSVAADLLRPLGQSGMLALCEEMLRSGDAGRREAAVKTLGKADLPESVGLLARVLLDSAAVVRDAAGTALKSMAARAVPGAREALTQNQSKAGDWADSILGALDAPKVVKIEGPLGDGNPTVRLMAIDQIQAKGDRSSIGALEALAGVEESPTVLERVLITLGKLQSRGSLPLIQECLDHRAPGVRRGALEALRWINDHTSLGPAVYRLEDEDPRVRAWAVITLAQLESHDILSPLKGLLSSSDLVEVDLGLTVVEEVKSRRIVECASIAMGHSDPGARSKARACLERLAQKKNPAALKLLEGAGPAPEEAVPAPAVPAPPSSGSSRSTRPVPVMLQGLNDPSIIDYRPTLEEVIAKRTADAGEVAPQPGKAPPVPAVEPAVPWNPTPAVIPALAPAVFIEELDELLEGHLRHILESTNSGAAPGAERIPDLLVVALKNELEASEEAAVWMTRESEVAVKLVLARQCGDEAKHFRIIADRLKDLGRDPASLDLGAGGPSSMFKFLEALPTTVERLAAGPYAREALALVRNQAFITFCEQSGDGETARLYRDVIQVDEEYHHQAGRTLLMERALTGPDQALARAAVLATIKLAGELQEVARVKKGLCRLPGC